MITHLSSKTDYVITALNCFKERLNTTLRRCGKENHAETVKRLQVDPLSEFLHISFNLEISRDREKTRWVWL